MDATSFLSTRSAPCVATLVGHARPRAREVPGVPLTCFVVPEFLTPDECTTLIARAESRGFHAADSDYPPSYRNNDRLVVDDDAFAASCFERLAPHVPPVIDHRADDGASHGWRLAALNSRFRWCRYRPGQRFGIHRDGVRFESPTRRSFLTFMVYLTDGDAFGGGDTLFLDGGPGSGPDGGDPAVIARVRPRAGMLIVFDHALWHVGDTVTSGTKHILRSDVVYAREAEDALVADHHVGYVWTLLALRDGRVASAGRDASIRLWTPLGKAAGVLHGHMQSILGLATSTRGVLGSVSRDRTLRLWDVASLTCRATIRAHDAASLSLVACEDGFASGGADGTIATWSDDGARRDAWRAHDGWVWSLAMVGERIIASASEDGTIACWDLATKQRTAVHVHHAPWRSIDARHDASTPPLLAAGDIDGQVTLLRVDGEGDMTSVGRWQAHDAAIRRVRWLRHDELATAGEDCRVRRWRIGDAGGTLIDTHALDDFATDVIARDDSLIACGYDGQLRRLPAPRTT